MRKTNFVIPPEIRRMLGPAPVLSTEDSNRFWEMLENFAQDLSPKNGREWFRVWDLTVSRWKLQRLVGYDNQVHESLHKQVVREAEQARAKKAEEEHKPDQLQAVLDRWRRPGRASPEVKAKETSAGPNTDDLPILSGLPLLKAKEHLLSCLLQRPKGWPELECTGLSHHHFRDRREWQQAFDLMLRGQDHVQAFIVDNPTSEIARLHRGGTWLRTEHSLSLVRQIVASVRAEEGAGNSNKALEPADRGPSKVEATNPETAPAQVEAAVLPQTEKAAPEMANKAADATELSLHYASVLQEHMPLLLNLDRLITAEQKRFDSSSALIEFERQCLALERHDLPSNVLEGEFKEIPAAGDADDIASAAQSTSLVQPVIGAAPMPVSITETAAISSSVGPPVPAPSSPPSVTLGLPDIQGGDPGEDADQTGGQLQSTEQLPTPERSTALTPIPILNATADDLASSAVAAANTGAGHGDHIEL
jgi:hypothetical protein